MATQQRYPSYVVPLAFLIGVGLIGYAVSGASDQTDTPAAETTEATPSASPTAQPSTAPVAGAPGESAAPAAPAEAAPVAASRPRTPTAIEQIVQAGIQNPHVEYVNVTKVRGGYGQASTRLKDGSTITQLFQNDGSHWNLTFSGNPTPEDYQSRGFPAEFYQ